MYWSSTCQQNILKHMPKYSIGVFTPGMAYCTKRSSRDRWCNGQRGVTLQGGGPKGGVPAGRHLHEAEQGSICLGEALQRPRVLVLLGEGRAIEVATVEDARVALGGQPVPEPVLDLGRRRQRHRRRRVRAVVA